MAGTDLTPTQLTLAIPNRNGARYLEETLRSLERNRPFVRWYLQDSCSEDHSLEIARRYASAEDQIVVQKDTSQADGLNRAFARMGGEIVGFLNSDDCLTEGAAEAVVKWFAAHPEIDLLYGEVEWIDAEGKRLGFHCGDISSLEEILDIYNVWWAKRQWVQPEVFFRRSVWERVGPFHTEYNLAFDYEYWVRCFLAGVRVKKLNRVLAQFRFHEAQKSTRSREAADEIRDIVARALAQRPPISLWKRLSLSASLGYDRYQCGQDYKNGGRPSFGRSLAQHPHWLLSPMVRDRLSRAVAARVLRH